MLRRRTGFGRGLRAVCGAFLLPAGAALLIWNEVHTADVGSALREAAGVVRDAPPGPVDPALEGKLIHAAGPVSVPARLADPDLPAVLAPPGTVQLVRHVQTFQWEERANRGSSYSYAQVWSETIIDSGRFHQPTGPQNPPPRFRPGLFVVPEAKLGAYRIGSAMLRSLGGAQPMAVAGDPTLAGPGLHLAGNTLYAGPDPATPHIGDQRVTWETIGLTEASVVAQQLGDAVVPYVAASGEMVELLVPSIVTARQMLADATQANTAGAWMTRVLGAGMLLLAVVLLRWRPAPV